VDTTTRLVTELAAAHPEHWMRAAAIRTLTLDAVHAANSGHSGMPMGMADVATVLYSKHLKFDAAAPQWPDRDRFILSAGHGSMLLYSLLYLTGYPEMTLEQLRNFRQWGAITAGHPEYGHAPGIETTTGPLGQGIANAVGFAIAEEIQRARLGKALVDHHTYVIAGDGCLMEGISQEAITLAGRQRLGRLIVFWDNNDITIDGKVSLSDKTDQPARFAAAGWHVQEIDGHDPDAIDAAITAAKASNLPSMIACKTHIALGHAAQDTSKGHGALTDDSDLAAAKQAYGWSMGPFEIPDEIKTWWEEVGRRGSAERSEWEARLAAQSERRQNDFARAYALDTPKSLPGRIRALKKQVSDEAPKVATRKSSEMVLEVVNPILPETVGGSADLTGSNNTKTGDLGIFDIDNRKGRYIHYGIREHAMAAAMNGMVLHGGIRPYGGTFFCFTDYARPAMRLAALMRIPTVFVMTHDSIGVGEDGPTHQPVEHLAICRATPNTHTFRPCDTVETAESWELALSSKTTPSVLALTRQGLPTLRLEHKQKNLTAQGAYVLAEATGKRRAILLATGSEVSVAMAARDLLQAEDIGTRVVSMPCWELFEAQDERYRRKVLPAGPVRVAVEAAAQLGWDRWLCGERGRAAKSGFVGMEGFGASAPAGTLFKEFGITAEAVAEKVKSLL
jgi:transketolase